MQQNKLTLHVALKICDAPKFTKTLTHHKRSFERKYIKIEWVSVVFYFREATKQRSEEAA